MISFLIILFNLFFFFFFQAEDGIRDWSVTGVQTCALPISIKIRSSIFNEYKMKNTQTSRREFVKQTSLIASSLMALPIVSNASNFNSSEIGRASCRERV